LRPVRSIAKDGLVINGYLHSYHVADFDGPHVSEDVGAAPIPNGRLLAEGARWQK
jgi:hypothetical protein